MTSENNEPEKQITRIRSVAWDGSSCPDGWDCPSLLATNWGTRITIGRAVTDAGVLGTLNIPEGQVAIEAPDELWDGAERPARLAADRGMQVTTGRLVTDPEVLRMLHLQPGEIAIETPDEE